MSADAHSYTTADDDDVKSVNMHRMYLHRARRVCELVPKAAQAVPEMEREARVREAARGSGQRGEQ